MAKVPHEALTGSIIGAAFTVHGKLGPGFVEKVYEKALIHELRTRGLRVESQVDVPIFYQGVEIHLHRLDLLVENLVVVETKAVAALTDVHSAILISYLKATTKEVGLLLNFGRPSLEHKRRVHPELISS